MRFIAAFDPYFAARGCAPFVWLTPRERELGLRAEAEARARADQSRASKAPEQAVAKSVGAPGAAEP